jgi:peptide/nickel transport system substrate-binding protein
MKPKSKIALFFNILFVNFRRLNFIERFEKVVAKMNLSEKMFFYLASTIAAVAGLVLLFQVNNSFLVEVPSFGGSFTEGLIGSPRFINPVIAISDTDKDLTSLIYSGLLKISENGGLEPDLAASYEMGEGGTVYDFKIKDRAYFHDGKEVTADDVIFTVERILDPVVKSPKEAGWEGITVNKINDKEVRFVLKNPYALFLQTLTLGILPKHIWKNVSSEEFPFSQFNIDPIGSGPYKIKKISRNSGGIPTTITLAAWNKYALGKPKIKSIVFKFFQNEAALVKAYEEKSVDGIAGLSQITAKNMITGGQINKASLPRGFGVFLNQNVAPVF